MAIFFGSAFKVANLFGLLPSLHPTNHWYKIIIAINVLNLASWTIHSFWFFLENTEDFDKSTFALGLSVNCAMDLAKIILLLLNNQQFLRLYLKLKRTCEHPLRDRATKDYISTRVEFCSRLFYFFIICICLAIVCTPLIVRLIAYLRNDPLKDLQWELPLPYANPLIDFESSPVFEITYITFSLGLYPVTMILASLDLFFLACCLHVYGLFKDLRGQMGLLVRNKDGVPRTRKNFHSNLSKCVDLQVEIYSLVQTIEEVFGGIFFTQYMGTIIIICIQAFLATQVGLIL